MRPFCRISVRLVSDKIGTRWVAITAVRPESQVSSREISVFSSVWSSAAVGSSSRQTSGSCNHSRAQPMLWR